MVNLVFSDEHERLREQIRAWIDARLLPHADAWERDRWYSSDVFGWMAERGWLGLKYEPRWGGTGGGYLADAVLVEELSRCGSGGTAAGIGAHVGIATPPIWKFGTDEQRERWLVPAIRGEKIGALAITEPGAGSDVASIRTRAERVDGGWVVNGAKTYITNGVRADFYVTAVRTTPQGGHAGTSFLVIEKGTDGISASKLEKLGWHASDTGEIAFDDVFVPDEHLLGELHGAFKLIMANFQWERLAMSLGAVGSMRDSIQRADADDVELHTMLATSAALTYTTLGRFAAGQDVVREVTMCKLLTQRAAVDVAEACWVATQGEDAIIERHLRDARLGPIGGGTDEIMREILSRVIAV